MKILNRRVNDQTILKLIYGYVVVVFGIALFNHGLVSSAEPRYAQVVLEMLRTGSWLIPIKNDVPYLAYTPLSYWLSMIAKMAGFSDAAAIRLPSMIALLFWMGALAGFQKLWLRKWPCYAFVLVGLATPGILYHFALAQPDGLLIAGLAFSFLGYARIRLDEKARFALWQLWGGLSFAVAAKGIVAVVICLPLMGLDIAVEVAHKHNWRVWGLPFWKECLHKGLKLLHLYGVVLLVAVAFLWYLAIGLMHGWDFFYAIVIYQNFERFLTGFDHIQPPWYFLMTLSYDAFAMIVLAPFALWAITKNTSTLQIRLPTLWVVGTVAFFSLSVSKQGKYILPAFPALVMLAFVALEDGPKWMQKHSDRLWRILRAFSFLILIAWAFLILVLVPKMNDEITDAPGFDAIQTQLTLKPGKLIHFGWPRARVLYELGSPMAYVRSARVLYTEIKQGEVKAQDYILVPESRLAEIKNPLTEIDASFEDYFKEVLRVRAHRKAVLLRVVDGVIFRQMPPTPPDEGDFIPMGAPRQGSLH